jgi:hypothetical protein
MAGIEDTRNIVAQLHEITAILGRNDRRDGVRTMKRTTVSQEVHGQHGGVGPK